MTKTKELARTKKNELRKGGPAEAIRERPSFLPRADIYENNEAIHILANMAGVAEDGVEITLERNELSLRGHVAPQSPEGMEMMYSEYAIGDYQRTFLLSEEVDREKIVATMRDGVLDLTLPKIKEARARHITVTTE
jgi:HSP20 family molecular chaperone IbpA